METLSPNLSDQYEDSRTLIISETRPDNEAVSKKSVLDSLPLKPQGRYRFLRSIGFGGMKGVLLVFDNDTNREIAMAIIPDFRERPRQELERFVQEAKITAKLEHPNIVPIHDIGIDSNGSPFFTMKYLRGSSLGLILRRMRLEDKDSLEQYPLSRLLQIFLRVVNAIGFAHSQGICHLDLKPGNINVGDFGEVTVLDWGLAEKMNGEDWHSGNLKGTPGFMPPELILSRGADFPGATADIYALGALLYTILALNPPLSGLPADEIIKRVSEGDIPPPSSVAPDFWNVPEGLEAICKKAMAFSPKERYKTATELKKDINSFRNGFLVSAQKRSPWLHLKSFIKRNKYMVIIAGLGILSVIAILLALYYRNLLY